MIMLLLVEQSSDATVGASQGESIPRTGASLDSRWNKGAMRRRKNAEPCLLRGKRGVLHLFRKEDKLDVV
jgi:hypothetical protein